MTDRCETCDRAMGRGEGECDEARLRSVRNQARGSDFMDANRAHRPVAAECEALRVDWRARAHSAEALLPDQDERHALAGLHEWVPAYADESDTKACEYVERLLVGMRGRK